jgi:hypothetical protein
LHRFVKKLTSLSKYFAGVERNDEVENRLKVILKWKSTDLTSTLMKNFKHLLATVSNYPAIIFSSDHVVELAVVDLILSKLLTLHES